MEAIIQTGGKQYRVKEGDVIPVERLTAKQVNLTPLLVTKEGKAVSGKASVKASVVEETKGEKLIVFKMRPKKRYRVKNGHRQKLSLLKIDKISA